MANMLRGLRVFKRLRAVEAAVAQLTTENLARAAENSLTRLATKVQIPCERCRGYVNTSGVVPMTFERGGPSHPYCVWCAPVMQAKGYKVLNKSRGA